LEIVKSNNRNQRPELDIVPEMLVALPINVHLFVTKKQ